MSSYRGEYGPGNLTGAVTFYAFTGQSARLRSRYCADRPIAGTVTAAFAVELESVDHAAMLRRIPNSPRHN